MVHWLNAEWKWNGSRMEVEWKWTRSGLEVEWKHRPLCSGELNSFLLISGQSKRVDKDMQHNEQTRCP